MWIDILLLLHSTSCLIFHVGKIIGFPAPYLGIVTKSGSFSALVSPILTHSSAIPKFKLPLPPGGANTHGKIFPYQNHDKIIFLYSYYSF